MNVQELVAKLEKMDPAATVWIPCLGCFGTELTGYMGDSATEAESVRVIEDGVSILGY